MTVPQKLKILIECDEWFNKDESYAEQLINVIQSLPGYPKVEIDADPSDEIRYVTSENYNEEKYEPLDTENFNIVSYEDDEVKVSAGGDWQAPLTFSIKEHEKTGKLHVVDIYEGYEDGVPYEEFDDFIENI